MYSIIYYLVVTLIDTFLYGYCYEIKQKGIDLNRGIFSSKIFDWIYDKIKSFIEFLFSKIIIYRIFQKIIEIGGMIIVAQLTAWSIPVLCGLVLSHLFMSYDVGYYALLNQFGLLKNSHTHITEGYTIGRLVFRIGWNTKLFIVMDLVGLGILIMTGLFV